MLAMLGCESADPKTLGPDLEAKSCAVVTSGMGFGWADLNHRISWMQLEPGFPSCEDAISLEAGFVGGDFSTGETMTDTPSIRYRGSAISAPGSLGVHHGSAELRITAPQPETGVTVTVDLTETHLVGFSEYVVLVDGFELWTELAQGGNYPNDYDPAHGYTTRGFGVSAEDLSIEGEALSFALRMRIAWGPSDRDDMNRALQVAATGAKVHYVLLGVHDGAVQTVHNAYRIDYELSAPLVDEPLAPPGPELTRVAFPTNADLPDPILGWSRFDLSLDPDGLAGGNETGPVGYYLREWWIDASLVERDGSTGEAIVDIAGYVSNASKFIAYYPMNLAFSGEVVAIQLPPDAAVRELAADEEFETGSTTLEL